MSYAVQFIGMVWEYKALAGRGELIIRIHDRHYLVSDIDEWITFTEKVFGLIRSEEQNKARRNIFNAAISI